MQQRYDLFVESRKKKKNHGNEKKRSLNWRRQEGAKRMSDGDEKISNRNAWRKKGNKRRVGDELRNRGN